MEVRGRIREFAESALPLISGIRSGMQDLEAVEGMAYLSGYSAIDPGRRTGLLPPVAPSPSSCRTLPSLLPNQLRIPAPSFEFSGRGHPEISLDPEEQTQVEATVRGQRRGQAPIDWSPAWMRWWGRSKRGRLPRIPDGFRLREPFTWVRARPGNPPDQNQ